jgi:hypothetical protein
LANHRLPQTGYRGITQREEYQVLYPLRVMNCPLAIAKLGIWSILALSQKCSNLALCELCGLISSPERNASLYFLIVFTLGASQAYHLHLSRYDYQKK